MTGGLPEDSPSIPEAPIVKGRKLHGGPQMLQLRYSIASACILYPIFFVVVQPFAHQCQYLGCIAMCIYDSFHMSCTFITCDEIQVYVQDVELGLQKQSRSQLISMMSQAGLHFLLTLHAGMPM